MKKILQHILTLGCLVAFVVPVQAQDNTSSATLRRGGDRDRRGQKAPGGVTERMQSFMETTEPSEADLQWMRVIYRQLDLTKDANTPLYYPDEPIDGQENLFRIIMRLIADGQITGYDYLDGREIFTDDYKLKVGDMLDRFHILATPAKGSTEKNPKYIIDESDVPANEVLSYYIVERWEFDKRSNRMRNRVEAICPVLHRAGDFYGEAMRYPMFWVKMDDLRPYLATQNIFTSDDNNLATCTYADYFQLGLYDGDIYKTRNLRNQSLMQMYPDPDALKHAQDSIQQRLTTFEDKLWVPSLEQLAARREAKELAEAKAAAKAAGDENGDAEVEADDNAKKPAVRSTRSKRGQSATKSDSSKKKPTVKVKRPKATKSSGANSGAAKSVRNRRKG